MRGDTTDVTRQLRGVERSLTGVGTAAGRMDTGLLGAHLSSNKLRGALTSLASQVTGTSPAVTRLSSVLGEMAVGGPLVLGITAGAAAVAGAYALLTRGAREATEEQRKLTKALAEQFAPKTGPQSETAKKYQNAIEQQADALRHLKILQSSSNDLEVAAKFIAAGEAVPFKKRADLIEEYTEALRQANVAIYRAQAGSVTALETVTVKGRDMVKVAADALRELGESSKAALSVFDSLASQGVTSDAVNKALITSYDRVAAKLREMGDVASVARSQMLDLQAALMGNIEVARHVAQINSIGTVGPLAGKSLPAATLAANGAIQDAVAKLRGPMARVGGADSIAITRNQKDQIDQEERNSQMLRDAIWGSATAAANAIVGALNIGGGGKGSGLGGGIGSALGFAAGFAGKIGFGLGGPIGGAIGSLVGQIGGSLIGGLFDHHKRSIDNNTAAVRENTQALLLYAPQGYSVAGRRIEAQRALRTLGDAARSNASRGGVPILTVGT